MKTPAAAVSMCAYHPYPSCNNKIECAGVGGPLGLTRWGLPVQGLATQCNSGVRVSCCHSLGVGLTSICQGRTQSLRGVS